MATKKEIIYSTIENKGKDVKNAPFWKDCHHPDDITNKMLKNGKQWYKYHVKFDGTVPIMVTKTEKIKKY